MRTREERLKIFNDLLVDSGILTANSAKKLLDAGYLEKPASSHHHGAYDGGLFDHSFEVAKSLVYMTEKLGLQWIHDRSPLLVGMLHDLCKLQEYIKIGNSWEYDPNIVMSGHGEVSVILAQNLVSLNEEEIMCIRWHSGAFDIKENWAYYDRAIEAYPNVLYTHTADMIASKITGI